VTDIQIPRFELRHRLQLSLELAGMKPADIAPHFRKHRNTIANWLYGRSKPDYAQLIVWAELTNVDEDWLVSGRVTDNPDYGDKPEDPNNPSDPHSYPYLIVAGAGFARTVLRLVQSPDPLRDGRSEGAFCDTDYARDPCGGSVARGLRGLPTGLGAAA
jgi:transcriptional regulator with XRE-family HTH domain